MDGKAWKSFFLLAERNQMLPEALDAVGTCGVPAEILTKYRREAVRLVALQAIRAACAERLYTAFCQHGLAFIVLEGTLFRSLHSNPEHYTAPAERIFIRQEDRMRFHEAMAECGMTTETPQADLSQARCVMYANRDRQVHMEVCSELFPADDGAAEKYFPNVWRNTVPVNIQQTEIQTLGHTDRLLYQILAAFRDCERGTLCLRQVCDTLLTARQYGEEIDWSRITETCRASDTTDFAAALFCLGRDELGIDAAGCPEELRQTGDETGTIRQVLLQKDGTGGAQKINSYEYLSSLRALSEEGKEVKLFISGSSMTPFLIHRRDSVVFRKPDRPLKRGDIVFYQRNGGQFVLHRILRVRGAKDTPLYDIVGDGQTEVERGVRRDQIFGLVVRAERKGKVIEPGSFWWQFFAGPWLWLLPLRPLLVRLYAALRGKRTDR